MRGWAGLALLVVACGGTPGKEPRSPARVDSSIRAPAKSEKAVACDAEPEALERVDAPNAVSEAFRAIGGVVESVQVEAEEDVLARARGAVRLKAGDVLTDALLRADVERLWALGDVEDVVVETAGAPPAVTFRVLSAPVVRASFGEGDGFSTEIAAALGLGVDDRLRQGALSEGLEKVRERWFAEGYRQATVSVTGVRLPDSRVDVCVHVDRGPQLLVGTVTITGNQAVPTEELRALITAKHGEPLSDAELERDVLNLQALYLDRGFVTTTVEGPEVTVKDGALSLQVAVNEGPKFTIGSITVAGDLATTKAAYLKKITLKPGDVFSRSRLLADIERLRELHQAQHAEGMAIVPETKLSPDKHQAFVVLRIVAPQK